jgi:hypothetical protein
MRRCETDDFGLAIYLSCIFKFQQVVVTVNGEVLLSMDLHGIGLIFGKADYWLQRFGHVEVGGARAGQ